MELIHRTKLDLVHKHYAGGNFLIEVAERIQAYLERNLSREYASVLSEPVINETEGTIDWYSEYAGELIEARDFNDIQKSAAATQLEGFSEKILLLSEESTDATIAEWLHGLFVIPREQSSVFLHEGKLVIANWGLLDAGTVAPEYSLREFSGQFLSPQKDTEDEESSSPEIPETNDSPSNEGEIRHIIDKNTDDINEESKKTIFFYDSEDAPWWWSTKGFLWSALLSILLFAFIFYLLLRHCAIGIPFSSSLNSMLLNYCPSDSFAPVIPDSEKLSILSELEQRLRDLPDCPREEIVEPIIPEPELPDEPERPSIEERGGIRGKVDISLLWNNQNDLDLYVICPNGQQISYKRKINCGGQLDIDMNVRADELVSDPIEHIRWDDIPESGTYSVLVKDAQSRNGNRTSEFRIDIVIGGEETSHAGVVDYGQVVTVTTFSIP
ncbi:MAG: hypothetical protein GKR95_08410 [Gammaproteobacteria bacterium]|nr:hypothetical protein [Gammaproteobacteria bacterium]